MKRNFIYKTFDKMKNIYAFGEPVPISFIKELIEEGYKEEDITTELIETILYYDFLDNEDD